MTEKRYYNVDYDEEYYIFDSNVIRKGRVEEEAEYSYDVFADSMSSTEIIDKLNELTNENEQLKQTYQTLKHRHSLLHDECLEAECDRDSLKKDVISLEKENENLNNVLEDFMTITNRLQSEPNNKSLQIMVRDMLRMMGKDIMGDSE